MTKNKITDLEYENALANIKSMKYPRISEILEKRGFKYEASVIKILEDYE